MSRVEKIKASIREAHFEPLTAPNRNPVTGLIMVKQLRLGSGNVLVMERRHHLR